MPERIDHVITVAADLASLEAAFTRLGFNVVGGGEHPHLGTRNRIILLDTGYIELLSIANEQIASAAVRQRIHDAPGWIGFALQSADIGGEVAAMRGRGADVRGPYPGRLVAPSGSVRSWQVAMVGGDDLFGVAEPIPFLIQHDSSGAQHQQELAGTDSIQPHPNGALQLASVVIAVEHLAASAADFARDYGLAAAGAPIHDTNLVADTVSLGLGASGERIMLAQPKGSGIVASRLVSAGAGLCCLTVTVSDLKATQEYLNNAGADLVQWADGSLFIPAEATGGAPLRFIVGVEHESRLWSG